MNNPKRSPLLDYQAAVIRDMILMMLKEGASEVDVMDLVDWAKAVAYAEFYADNRPEDVY